MSHTTLWRKFRVCNVLDKHFKWNVIDRFSNNHYTIYIQAPNNFYYAVQESCTHQLRLSLYKMLFWDICRQLWTSHGVWSILHGNNDFKHCMSETDLNWEVEGFFHRRCVYNVNDGIYKCTQYLWEPPPTNNIKRNPLINFTKCVVKGYN